nr:MAG TPA: hypothetical protein [Caudoviricetes sp.]
MSRKSMKTRILDIIARLELTVCMFIQMAMSGDAKMTSSTTKCHCSTLTVYLNRI